MATINKIPKCPPLRFPDFNDYWKETTLGEVAEIKKGSGLSKEDLTESGQPVILYGELYTTYTKEVIDTIYSKTNVNSEKLVVTNGGEVIIPSSGETAWDIATARCVIPSNVILGGDLNIITLKKDNGAFFSYFLNGVRKRAIAEIAQGSSVVHLYGKDIIKLSVSLPSLEEQKKIADFFSLIDERIQSCSETIKELKTQKAGLLNQLFSQKLRFPDFNDEWTQTTLGEIAEIKKGSTLSKLDLVDTGNYGAIHYGELFTQYKEKIIQVRSKTNHAGFTSLEGDILMPSSDVTPFGLASASCIFLRDVILGGDMNIIRCTTKKVNPMFLTYYLLSRKNDIISKVSGTTVKHIYPKDLISLEILLPSLEEQKKIADFLSLIDERIEVEEQLLQQYEKQKRYLLKQMFV